MNKEEVKKNFELIGLQYNRLYKRSFYWVLSTVDKETVICVQNSLRELIFEDIKVKYDIKNKNQLSKIFKEQIDKISYKKEAKGLGVNNINNSNFKNNNNRHKSSDDNFDAFSWRKGSGDTKSSNDDNSEKFYRGGNYYHKKNRRRRFNSDGEAPKYPKTYNNDYNKYPTQPPKSNNTNKEIEIDISTLKYPLVIKYKYSFNEMKNIYQKLLTEKFFDNHPSFTEDKDKEVCSDKMKNIVTFDELIASSNKIKEEETKKQNIPPTTNTTNLSNNMSIPPSNPLNTIKIPKMNPLSSMNISRTFNKFDSVPGNAPIGIMPDLLGSNAIPQIHPDNLNEVNKGQ